MSKKGKKGESKLMTTLGKVGQVEDNFEARKPTFTNAPDDGLDFELLASANIGEKFDSIVEENESHPPTSDSKIKVRIDHKDYQDKIGKPVADKFVADCSKHPHCAEHWMTGGAGLTKGAVNALNNAEAPTRYYPQESLDRIDQYYQNEINNTVAVSSQFTDDNGNEEFYDEEFYDEEFDDGEV